MSFRFNPAVPLTTHVINIFHEGKFTYIFTYTCCVSEAMNPLNTWACNKWRRDRDSNPGYLSVRRFSRPVHSTTLPPLLDLFGNTSFMGS